MRSTCSSESSSARCEVTRMDRLAVLDPQFVDHRADLGGEVFGVVDHEQRAGEQFGGLFDRITVAVGTDRRGEGCDEVVRGVQWGEVEPGDRTTLADGLRGDLAGEPGLAGSGVAEQRDQGRAGEVAEQFGLFVPAADEALRCRGQRNPGHRGAMAAEVVLDRDGLRCGVDAEFVGELVAQTPEPVERLGLPVGAGEREGGQADQAFVQWMGGDETFEVGADGVTESQAGLDPDQLKLQLEGLQALPLRCDEGDVVQIAQWLTTPEVDRGRCRREHAGVVVSSPYGVDRGERTLGGDQVGRLGPQAEPRRTPVEGTRELTQRTTQPGRQHPQPRGRPGRVRVSPQVPDQDVIGNRFTPGQREPHGQRPSQRLPHRKPHPGSRHHLGRAKDIDLQEQVLRRSHPQRRTSYPPILEPCPFGNPEGHPARRLAPARRRSPGSWQPRTIMRKALPPGVNFRGEPRSCTLLPPHAGGEGTRSGVNPAPGRQGRLGMVVTADYFPSRDTPCASRPR